MTWTAEERRAYNTPWARRKRAKKLAQQMAHASRCPFRLGPYRCETPLVLTTHDGHVIATCPTCERRKRGICLDCHLPVAGTVGRALRCAAHQKARRDAACERYKAANADLVRARARERCANNPDARERRRLRNAVRRLTKPEAIKREKRRALLKEGPVRDRRLAHSRKINAKRSRKLRKQAMAKLDYYRAHPVRPVPICKGCSGYLDWTPKPGGKNGRPPSRCDGCCDKYELARRRTQGRSIGIVPEPPAAAYLPPLRELERKIGPRTCLSDGCTVIMKGRAKKCEACKARDVELALRALAELVA